MVGSSNPLSAQLAPANNSAPVPDSPASQKLRKAAGEFESMLLANLWKSMKGTFAEPDDDSSDPAHGALDDLGIQTMSSAVGKAGGLGIGKLILKNLEPLIPSSQSGNSA